jgi:uncharacterized membrane protein
MTDTTQMAPATNEARIAALIGYALFILAVANGITAIAGVVLAYIKRADGRGTVWESHFTNMIRVFWVSVLASVLLIGVVVFGVADLLATINQAPHIALIAAVPLIWLFAVAFFVWYLYRTVRGLLRALENKAY